MRLAAILTIVSVAACAGATIAPVSATDLSPCAVACVQTGLPLSGCEISNITCLCTSSTYIASVSSCLKQYCSVKESLVARRFQSTTCGAPVRSETDFARRVLWTLCAVVAFSVAARIAFRVPALKGSGLGADDYTLVIAFLLTIPLDAIVHDMTDAGLGQDVWVLPCDNITRILHLFWIAEFFYIWLMTLTKVSIVLLYLRIWVTPAREGRDWFRISCFCMIVFLITFAIVISLTLGFECNPISFAWLRWDNEHSGSCFDLNAQVFAIAGVNIAQDLMVCFLPLPKLFATSLPLRKKLVVVCIFLVGLFVTICSVIRLQYLIQWGTTENPTWYYTPIALWSGIECGVAIICACLPAMAGLMQRMYRHCVGTAPSAGFGSSASRQTERQSGQLKQWHELQSPSSVVTGKLFAGEDSKLPAYHAPQQVSAWD